MILIFPRLKLWMGAEECWQIVNTTWQGNICQAGYSGGGDDDGNDDDDDVEFWWVFRILESVYRTIMEKTINHESSVKATDSFV